MVGNVVYVQLCVPRGLRGSCAKDETFFLSGSSTAGTKQGWRTGGCSRPPHAWVAHASHLAARLDMKQDSEAEVLRAVCAAALRPRGGGVAAVDSFPYRVARCR